MPDIFHFQSERWDLVIWTRNSSTPKKMLASILNERGKALPLEERVCFSFPLTGTEICKFEDNYQQKVDAKRSEIKIPGPLCYENRDYEFEFRFQNGYKPDRDKPVINRMSEIENSFRSVGTSSRGVINFGNNLGWFKLGIRYHGEGRKEGRKYTDTISFRVFPTKMDMENDLDEIGKVIDSTYPLWRFSLAQKTDSILSRSSKRHGSFELLWLAQFSSLAQELAGAGKLICRSPHSRLILNVKSAKAERITGKIEGRLEERIKENLIEKRYDKRYQIERRKLSYDTPENRFVKMVLLYSVRRLKIFSARVRGLEKNPENARLSESFYDELCQLISPFEKLSSEPLFREIGSYDGRMCESLVLHQRAGYAKVYRIWQQLKLYLDFFGDDASISVRSMEQLYEIWCLLELRRKLMDLGFNEGKSPSRNLKTIGFEKRLKQADEIFHLHRPDGMRALLVHGPSYSGPKNPEFDKIYSWTTTQRPDIFLEITLPAGDKVRWVFDAKYRIDSSESKKWPQAGIDTVPDDAINQMHRYRDSLIYISKAVEDGDRDKSRPIVGAFALYPGWFDQNSSENPYKDSVEAVGIGAFPLLPGQENRWLAEFLKGQIGEYSETGYAAKEVDELYLQEFVRIPPYGMKQYRHSELILAADIFNPKGRAYVIPFEEGRAQWYHIPESTVQNYRISRHVMREMKFCAFSTTSGGGRICNYLYPVVSVALKQRNEIDEYAGGPSIRSGDSLYWLIELGRSFKTPVKLCAQEKQRKFNFRLISFHDFLKAESWDEIPRKYFE